MSRGLKVFFVIMGLSILSAFLIGLLNRSSPGVFGKEALGLLKIEGVIDDVEWYMEQVDLLRENNSVRAVVLRIDSPGGAVAPTQELYDELLKLREDKPLVVSMGTVAASGGYYLSSAADWIVSNPGTLTGSIGVIMHFTNLEEMFGKLGVRSEIVKSGEYKDTGSPFREMTENERDLLTDMVMDIREQFVEAVVEGRQLDYEEVDPYFDGRVFSGRQALEIGLVDELGNVNVALEKAAALAGLPKVPSEIIQPEKRERSLFSLLFGRSLSDRTDALIERLGGNGYGSGRQFQ
ncbi:signal peptide peptidase SppA, partial [bacterium]